MHKLSLTDPATESSLDSTPISSQEPQSSYAAQSVLGKKPMKKSSPTAMLVPVIIAIILGVATGFGGSKLSAKQPSGKTSDGTTVQRHPGDSIKNGDVFGSTDESTFKDNAEGYLELGGVDGEGSHKLLRLGGVTKTVYLTSSVVDLDKFQNMEVKVWGETYKGQKAGWLMDVGRVQVVNTQATPPVEEE